MPGQQGLQGRFLGWAAVAVLATYALFVGGAWAPTYSVFFRIITLILCAVGIAVWLIVAIRNPFWRPRSVLAPAFAAAFAAFLISTLASRYPRFGFEYLAWSIILAALYLLLQRLMASSFFRVRLIGFATLSALVIGSWYVAAVVPQWFEWWSIIGRFSAPPLRPTFESLVWGNPSAVLTAILLLACPAIAFLWGGSRVRWFVLGVIVVLTIFVIVASGSRAGWLAVALAVVIVGIVWIASAERRDHVRRLIASRTFRIGIVPIAGVAIFGAALLGPGLINRLVAGGDGARSVYYTASLRMFASSPITGTGAGTWAPLRIANTAAGETDYYIPHAHSVYFQTLAELGLVGVIAGIVVLAFLGRLLVSGIRDEDPLRRRMGWVALFATVYFGAHQLLDFYENAPAMLFAYAIPIAWLDATATQTEARWPRAPALDRVRPVLRVGVIAALVGAVAFLAWSENAALRMNDGTVALNDRDESEAVAPLQEAVALDPAMPPYHFALGLALANAGDLQGAETQFAMAATDDLPEAWLNLASVRAGLGMESEARAAIDRALRLGSQQGAVALGAGAVLLELGDTDGAVSAFALALRLLPSLAGDSWWTEDPDRSVLWDRIYETALTDAAPETIFELALEAGDLNRAAETLEGIGDAQRRPVLASVLEAWTGDQAAMAALEAQSRDDPFDVVAANWYARLLRLAGEDVRAEPYLRQVSLVSALSGGGAYVARVVHDDEPYIVAGVNSLFYGHFTYRRPTPSDQFVPQLPHLAYQ